LSLREQLNRRRKGRAPSQRQSRISFVGRPSRKPNPFSLCFLCYLLFKFSLFASVSRKSSQKGRSGFEQKVAKATKGWELSLHEQLNRRRKKGQPVQRQSRVRRFVGRPSRRPNPFSLCFLCYLLFKFSLFASVSHKSSQKGDKTDLNRR
jgi:hypothetical protein